MSTTLGIHTIMASTLMDRLTDCSKQTDTPTDTQTNKQTHRRIQTMGNRQRLWQRAEEAISILFPEIISTSQVEDSLATDVHPLQYFYLSVNGQLCVSSCLSICVCLSFFPYPSYLYISS